MRVILAIGLLAGMALRSGAVSIEITAGGKSDYAILTPRDPSLSEALAAQELSRYVQRMSGVEIPIHKGGRLSSKSLVVCEGKNLAQWPMDAPKVSVTGDEYAIIEQDGNIWLLGGRGRSVLYATYGFLEKLGCRWLAPNFDHYRGTGEVIPKRRVLSLSIASPVIEKPALAFRKLYVEEGHSHNADNLIQMAEWMAKNRFNTLVIPMDYSGRGVVKWDNWREKVCPELRKRDITIEVGGHGYQNFINADMEGGKLYDRHPEWFGQDNEGKRRKERGYVFCISNPEAVRYLIQNFARYVKERPEIQIYDFWPPDGARWCECSGCKAIGDASALQAHLLAQVKAEVAKIRPDLRLEIIAYHKTIFPPAEVRLDKDILIDFCPIAQCFEVQINDPASDQNAEYVRALTAWRRAFDGDISIYSYYRKYAWKSLPNVIPHYMQKDLEFYLSLPVQGISSYAEPGDWFTYELNHYTLARLAWNPSADVDTIVSEFCRARYGSEARSAMQAFQVLEDVVRHSCSIPGTKLKTANELSLALKKLDRAKESLEGCRCNVANAGIVRNMARLLLALEYARRDIEIQKSRAMGEPEEKTQRLVEDLASWLAKHGDEGVFCMHSRLQQPKLGQSYGLGG